MRLVSVGLSSLGKGSPSTPELSRSGHHGRHDSRLGKRELPIRTQFEPEKVRLPRKLDCQTLNTD